MSIGKQRYSLESIEKCPWLSYAVFVHQILFTLQAILFYVPRWLWKNWEAGKIHALMMDLDIGVVQDVEKRQKKRLLLDYLTDNRKHHNWWAYRYFFCEFLALVNIIGKFEDSRLFPKFPRNFPFSVPNWLCLQWVSL